MQDEKVIVIDINLTRGPVVLLALALLMAAFIGYLAWGQREAIASSPQVPFDHAQGRPLAASSGMRQYYLTKTFHRGDEALTACATGYHMASLWEILDPSNLKYDTDLGITLDDSGQAPPSYFSGWVRTGYESSTSSTPGLANCNAWTSTDSGHRGTHAYLPRDWTAGQDIYAWEAEVLTCSFDHRVWCVED